MRASAAFSPYRVRVPSAPPFSTLRWGKTLHTCLESASSRVIYHATRRRLPKARRALAMGRLKQYSLKRELAQRFIQKRRVRVPSAPPFWSLGPKNPIPTVIESASSRVIYHATRTCRSRKPLQRGVADRLYFSPYTVMLKIAASLLVNFSTSSGERYFNKTSFGNQIGFSTLT